MWQFVNSNCICECVCVCMNPNLNPFIYWIMRGSTDGGGRARVQTTRGFLLLKQKIYKIVIKLRATTYLYKYISPYI